MVMGRSLNAGRLSRKLIAAGILMGSALIVAAGCGESEKKPDPGTQATVSGSVLKDGKPIAVDSVVTFFCDQSSATAGGKIDALGKVIGICGGGPDLTKDIDKELYGI